MKAVVITHPGPPEVLSIAERPTPVLRPDQVLVKVWAAGVNRADLAQRAGHYPPPPGVSTEILGLEIAGEVEACGAAVTRWKPGDRVCALLAGGGYAEQVAVDATHCLRVPTSWSWTDAAALPETVFTVWSNVFERAHLQPGERLLVHGGSSGIGLTAIQLARLFGSSVVVTAGNAEKCAACVAQGAEQAINYRTDDFVALLEKDGVDVILDMVGGSYVARNLKVLRAEGRLVFINGMEGAKGEIDLPRVMSRRLTLTGSTLRGRESAFKARVAAAVEKMVWPLVEAGKFRANVCRVFPFADAAAAHRLVESSQHIGKVVLAVRTSSSFRSA